MRLIDSKVFISGNKSSFMKSVDWGSMVCNSCRLPSLIAGLTLYHLIRRHPDLPAAVQSGVIRCPAVPFNPAQSGIDNMCCVIGDIPVIAAENVIKTRGKHQTRSQGLVVECVM